VESEGVNKPPSPEGLPAKSARQAPAFSPKGRGQASTENGGRGGGGGGGKIPPDLFKCPSP